MLAWLKAASSGEVVTSEHHRAELETQVSGQERGNTYGPTHGGLVDVTIGDCELEARLVGRPAELAGKHHDFDGPCQAP